MSVDNYYSHPGRRAGKTAALAAAMLGAAAAGHTIVDMSRPSKEPKYHGAGGPSHSSTPNTEKKRATAKARRKAQKAARRRQRA